MILYAPLRNVPQAEPRQGMVQPEFYSQQQPTTADLVAAQIQKMRQRTAPPKLEPGARVQDISPSIASPENFQNFYRQLSTIKQVGQEQVARAQAEAALAQIRAQQQLNQQATAVRRQPSSSGNKYVPAPSGGGSVPSNPKENFKFAQGIAGNYGWNNPGELAAWYTLGMKESGWRSNAQNPTSTAYGIGQFLDSTWKGYGIPKTSDPALQVEAMARYIRARYGSPSKALAFHRSHNWY